MWGVFAPEQLAYLATTFTFWAFDTLDWFFLFTVSALLVVCCGLACSSSGRLRLSQHNEGPEFSTLSWLAMLFAAGMGTGLVFWGAAEPMLHYLEPPLGAGETASAARHALVLTAFHWGFHAWAVYGVAALVLAYFGFRRRRPYLPGEPLRTVFKTRWVAPVAWAADLVAMVAIFFGVAGSMGMGIRQIHTGLHLIFGASIDSMLVPLGVLVVLFAAYMASASTSLDKGIRWLSNLNILVAIGLMGFVLLMGPTATLLRGFFVSVGEYLISLPGMSLRLYDHQQSQQWTVSWTLTYFAWWIAWAPFVGVFIARISRGRTIREFVCGVMLVPTLFSLLWFAVFGGSALHQGGSALANAVREDVTMVLFSLFAALPLGSALSTVALILVFVFLVTSVDSATFVLGMLSESGSLNPSRRHKLAWGVGLAVLAAAIIFAGNIDSVRAIAVAGAIPFTVVLVLQVVALLRALWAERARHQPADSSASPGGSVPAL